MNVKLSPSWFYGTLVVVACVWVLHSFLLPLLVACVTAVASWPLYTKLAERLRSHLGRKAWPLVFTALVTVFVLAPLTFAFSALVAEVHGMLLALAAADKHGIAVPNWLETVPIAGPWLAARWQTELAHPGALMLWAQRTDPTALFGWAHSLGLFVARHVLIIGFTILVLFFLYQRGESLADEFRRLLRHRIGKRADRSMDVAMQSLRASVNSMLVVALFDGFVTGVIYALIGVPHAAVWGAITGALGLVPFLGFVAVAVLTLQLAVTNASLAFISSVAGCAVLICGDKVLRPVLARYGTRLPFVWVLMGCLGGFEVLGLVGLVIGPVVLTLARELWEQGLREAASDAPASTRSSVAPSIEGSTAQKAALMRSVQTEPRR